MKLLRADEVELEPTLDETDHVVDMDGHVDVDDLACHVTCSTEEEEVFHVADTWPQLETHVAPKPKPQSCKKHSRCHCDLLSLETTDFFAIKV